MKVYSKVLFFILNGFIVGWCNFAFRQNLLKLKYEMEAMLNI